MQSKLKAAAMILAVVAGAAFFQRNVYKLPIIGDYLPS